MLKPENESRCVIGRNNPIQNTLIVKLDMKNFKSKKSRMESKILVSINNKRDFIDIREDGLAKHKTLISEIEGSQYQYDL